MCIIGYAPAGAQIKEETVRIMFKGNPDGAGIMWKPTPFSAVEIRKGFMTVEELIKAYYEIPVECEKAIHCRIATSGKISAACCHPFPIRAKATAMMNPVDKSNMALMHNGVIHYCEPVKGMKANYSDTMLFASRILYPFQKMLDKEALQTLIEESTTSRLLIFRKDADTIMLGDWQYNDGVYYSNGNYKERPIVAKYSYGSYYNNWERDYSYDDGNYNYLCDSAPTQQKDVWEYLIIDIGETDKETALQAIQDEVGELAEDFYIMTPSTNSNEVEIEVMNFYSEANNIAGFPIVDRITYDY